MGQILRMASAGLVGSIASICFPCAAVAVQPGAIVTTGELEGVVWVLTGYGAAGSLKVPAGGSRIDVSFEQGRASGSSGCNSYAGSYALDGAALGIGPLAATRKACPPPLMEQEDAYHRILKAVETATVTGDTLTLAGKEGTLTFAAERELKLVGVWEMVGYNNGKAAVVSAKIGTKVTLVLDAGGRVSGSSGCNTYSGSYKLDGSSITIGPLASTRKMCVDADVMAQEGAFLKALQAGTRIELRGDDLRLRNGAGATQVHFKRSAQ